MVLIPLPAPVVGLLVTITTAACELAFLTAALILLKYVNCRRLLKNQKLRLRMHKRSVTFVTLLAMLMFVALETLFSVFSDAVLQTDSSIQDCVRTIAKRNVTYANGNEAEAILFRCTNVNGVDITHHFGNYSLQNTQIQCSDKMAYSFRLASLREIDWKDGVQNCVFRSCSKVFLRGNMFYFTGQLRGRRKPGEKIKVLPTNVTGLNITKKDLPRLSKKLNDLYQIPIYDEAEVRRNLLLGSIRDECPFSVNGPQGTRVSLVVIAITAAVWLASLLFLGVSILFRRSIFFDLSDPMHWANRARHDVTDAVGIEPMVQWTGSPQGIRILGYENNKGEIRQGRQLEAIRGAHDDYV